VPESTFLKVLAFLLVATVVTVVVAKMEMFNVGKWNIVGALLIASVKASAVIWFFMHGKYENKILWTYILIPFILLVIMIGGVFSDNHRAEFVPSESKAHHQGHH
jgi:cytochrome c oxidase subunit 4